MGNPFSKSNKEGYQFIENDLNTLVKNHVFAIIDKNNDNTVSKQEFDEWNEIMNNNISKINNKFEQTISDKDKEIKLLKGYINGLEQDKEELEKYNQQLLLNFEHGIQPEIVKSIISKTKVRQYVKKILQDENINIKHFPDSIEEAIYTNVIYMVLKIINNFTECAEINIIDHKFRIVVH